MPPSYALHTAAVALTLVFAMPNSAEAASANMPLNITYSFIGSCLDCTGNGVATLVLQNYTPGNAITSLQQLVSFTYAGTDLLAPYTITSGPGVFVSGTLPAAQGTADFVIFDSNTNNYFATGMFAQSSTSDGWETGPSFIADYGVSTSFAIVDTPEPNSILMLGAGLTGLVALRGRKK